MYFINIHFFFFCPLSFSLEMCHDFRNDARVFPTPCTADPRPERVSQQPQDLPQDLPVSPPALGPPPAGGGDDETPALHAPHGAPPGDPTRDEGPRGGGAAKMSLPAAVSWKTLFLGLSLNRALRTVGAEPSALGPLAPGDAMSCIWGQRPLARFLPAEVPPRTRDTGNGRD